MNLESDKRLIQLRLDFSSAPTGEARQARREDIESLSVVSEPERPTNTLCLERVSATSRTAVYGPVRTVVWEGRSREAPPIPINGTFRTERDFRVRVRDAQQSGRPRERRSGRPLSYHHPAAPVQARGAGPARPSLSATPTSGQRMSGRCAGSGLADNAEALHSLSARRHRRLRRTSVQRLHHRHPREHRIAAALGDERVASRPPSAIAAYPVRPWATW